MPSFVEATTYSGAAPSNTIVYTDGGQIFAAGNIQTDSTALAPTIISNTINAATIGNTGAVFTGASSTLTDTVIAATVNAATIGNIGAVFTGNTGTLTSLQVTAIGNVAPGTAAFTTATAGSLQGIIGNAAATTAFFTTANATTIQAATIGNTSAAHVGASATLTGTVIAATVNAATIGNTGAAIIGNTGTLTSLQVTAIGNVTPGTAVFTTANATTVNATSVNATSVNATSVNATSVNAATIGNTSAAHVGSTGTFSSTLIAATVNAATIGNSGATLTGTVGTASQPNITTLAGVTSIGATGVITTVVGNLTVGGNFTVSGNSVSIGASTLSIVDPIISLNTPADLSPLTTTTTADIGLKLHYYSGSDRHAFLGRAQDTGYLEWYSDGNDTGNVFTGTAYGTIKAGAMFLANTGTGLTVAETIVAKTLNAATIGNIGANMVGTGTYLTSLTGSQVSGTVPLATTATYVTGLTAGNVQAVIGSVSAGSFPTLNQNTTGTAATVTTASQPNITSVGTLTSLAVGAVTSSGTIIASTVNAATIGNIGANMVGTGTYLTSLNASNLSSGTVSSSILGNSTLYVGTTAIVLNRASASQSLTGVNIDGNAGGSAATFTSTSQNSQFNSVGVGTTGSATTGEIRATNNITAYYSSDAQFKENIQPVPDALSIVTAIGSKLFDWTDAYIAQHGGEDGYFVQKSDFGVVAQDVQRVFPQAVRTRPDGSLAVDYEKLATLSFGAIEQLLARVEALEAKLN